MAGLHTSNIIIPNEELRANFLRTASDKNYITGTNPFGIVAAQAAYEQGEEWLTKLLEYVQKNMEFIDAFCKQHLKNVKLVQPEGTYLAWLDFTGLGLSQNELTDIIIRKAKIALDEGYFFGEEGVGFERINAACPRTIVETCMNRIKAALA